MSDGFPLEGLRVLVVEDDYLIAEDARCVLEKAGAEVIGPVRSVEDIQGALGRSKPDCAILDINLGEGPDYLPAETMMAEGIPVIFVTGYDQEAIPIDFSSVELLQKPAKPGTIIRAVEEICERARSPMTTLEAPRGRAAVRTAP